MSGSKVGDSGRGNDTGAFDLRSGFAQPGGQGVGDPCAGFTRVLADDQPSWSGGQMMPEGEAHRVHGLLIQRILAGDATDSIGAEELSQMGFLLRGLSDGINCTFTRF